MKRGMSEPQMDTDGHRFALPARGRASAEEKQDDPLSREVIGAAMAVLNELGCGLREKTYERALCVELGLRGIPYSQQSVFPVFYQGVKVDEFVPDLVVDDSLIVDAKTVDALIDEHIGQILNYLKVTRLSRGLLINFKHARLSWRRVIL